MPKRIRQIAAFCLAAIALAGCDSFTDPPPFSIQEISPDTVRTDKPTTLTITGTGFDGTQEVRFGFDRKGPEIDSVKPTNVIGSNTLEVVTPALPGLNEKTKVWVSVTTPYDQSDPVAITYRPPNIIDLYGMYALAVIGAVTVLTIAVGLFRRGFRRMSFRRAVLEAKGRRLMLRDERHANAVLEELAAEKRAEQEKLEAEYLPYADQASGADADE